MHASAVCARWIHRILAARTLECHPRVASGCLADPNTPRLPASTDGMQWIHLTKTAVQRPRLQRSKPPYTRSAPSHMMAGYVCSMNPFMIDPRTAQVAPVPTSTSIYTRLTRISGIGHRTSTTITPARSDYHQILSNSAPAISQSGILLTKSSSRPSFSRRSISPEKRHGTRQPSAGLEPTLHSISTSFHTILCRSSDYYY